MNKFLGRLPKVFSLTFHNSLPKKRVTNIGITSLDGLKETWATIVPLVVICDSCNT